MYRRAWKPEGSGFVRFTMMYALCITLLIVNRKSHDFYDVILIKLGPGESSLSLSGSRRYAVDK